MKKRKHHSASVRRARAVVLSLLLILSCTVGGTAAFLVHQSETIANTFTLSEVPISVNETGVVTNNGTASAYIRAAVVVNWVDAEGRIYSEMPEESAYTIALGDGWIKHTDGYYYYTLAVEPGQSTTPINVYSTSVLPPEEGLSLQASIGAQSIQAEGVDENGASPRVLAWGYGS